MSRAAIFALKRADLATRAAMDEALATHGLTSAQLDILLYLDERGAAAQRDIQAALGVTSATLTRILDGMVTRGFVERRASDADARAKCVSATDAACALLLHLKDDAEPTFLARFTAGFTPDEMQTLTRWLTRLAANMGDTSQPIFGYGASPAQEECAR